MDDVTFPRQCSSEYCDFLMEMEAAGSLVDGKTQCVISDVPFVEFKHSLSLIVPISDNSAVLHSSIRIGGIVYIMGS